MSEEADTIDLIVQEHFKTLTTSIHKSMRESGLSDKQLNKIRKTQAWVDGIELFFGNVEYPSKFALQVIMKRQ